MIDGLFLHRVLPAPSQTLPGFLGLLTHFFFTTGLSLSLEEAFSQFQRYKRIIIFFNVSRIKVMYKVVLQFRFSFLTHSIFKLIRSHISQSQPLLRRSTVRGKGRFSVISAFSFSMFIRFFRLWLTLRFSSTSTIIFLILIFINLFVVSYTFQRIFIII